MKLIILCSLPKKLSISFSFLQQVSVSVWFSSEFTWRYNRILPSSFLLKVLKGLTNLKIFFGDLLYFFLSAKMSNLPFIASKQQNMYSAMKNSIAKSIERHIAIGTSDFKGQLIWKAKFKVSIWTRNRTEIFLYFCLAL